MFKWLHRGNVRLLLVAAVAAAVVTLSGSEPRVAKYCWGENSLIDYVLLGVAHDRFYDVSSFRLDDDQGKGKHILKKSMGICVQYIASDPVGWPKRPSEALARLFDWRPRSRTGYLYLAISPWLVIAITAPYPCFFLYRTWRRRRCRHANACPRCNYDFTGNESGICPECGTVVEAMA